LNSIDRRNVIVAAAIVSAALAFLPGIAGNFQLDDIENLAPVQRMLAGDVTWQYTVFSNRSGVLGRPVAMASFVLNAWATGLDVTPFRLGNIALHALCGLLVWRLVEQVLHGDRTLAGARQWLPPAIAVGWVLLPIHVSTVLYVVQRMAMLSAIFIVLALLAYLAGRRRVQAGERGGWIWLFAAFPVLTALAALSKENGILAPAYALAIELGCFGLWRAQPEHRSLAIKVFFTLFVAAPAVALLGWLALHPELVTAGYAGRSFTLGQRVLTETRVLWDYVRGILLPVGSALGLVQDDYTLSRSLLQPWTTALAITAWLVAFAAALRQCGRRPAFATGILFFLAGHAMESTVLPLEIRFDHRNYLAAVGILLATAGGVAWLLERLVPERTRSFRRAGAVLLVLVGCAYAFATMARSALWADEAAMYRQLEASRPDSPRLQAILAARAMQSGDLQGALRYIDTAERLSPEDALAPAAWRVLAHCIIKVPPPLELVDRIGSVDATSISLAALKGIERVAASAEAGDCPGIERDRLAAALEQLLARTGSAPTDHGNWRTRYHRARLLASESRWPEALAEGQRAWTDSAYNNGVGVFVFQLHASVGDKAGCRRVLDRLRATANPGDLALAGALAKFQKFVDS
jgi:tetratricopeptide (TPR) repeat protein